MKAETKETVEFIKATLWGYKVHTETEDFLDKETKEQELKNINSAIRFLNSLPEIEEKLCFGGYIQDYNGTPCCHGDKVVYKNKEYTLQWSQPYSRFFLKADKSVRDVWDFGRIEISKVIGG